jgi:hypothetical protein
VLLSRAAANVVRVNVTAPLEWRSYEQLTEELVGRLGSAHGITTLRL